MTSIPQLRKDINDLQRKLWAADAEVKRLRELSNATAKVTVQEKIVEVPVIKYVDNPKHIEMIRKLQNARI